jgi:hypothetical protein
LRFAALYEALDGLDIQERELIEQFMDGKVPSDVEQQAGRIVQKLRRAMQMEEVMACCS